MSQLEVLIKEINKKFGDQVATVGVKSKHYDLIPFSSPRVNYMLYGGLPRNRLIEFAGPESSGKTTSALDIIGQYQKLADAKKVLFIDNEQTFDEEWATLLGVNCEDLILVQPEGASGEQILQMFIDFVNTGEIGLGVIDSVATLVPGQIVDEDMEKGQIGGIARTLTTFCNKIVPLLKKNECTCICINQVRDDMNNPYNLYTTPGGKAFKHHCSVRLFFQQGAYIDNNNKEMRKSAENPAGNLVNIVLKKSKVCRPDRRVGFYSLKYMNGIDYFNDTIDCALQMNLITQRGAYFDIYDFETGEKIDEKFQGRESVVKYYKCNEVAFKQLYDKVLEKMNASDETLA